MELEQGLRLLFQCTDEYTETINSSILVLMVHSLPNSDPRVSLEACCNNMLPYAVASRWRSWMWHRQRLKVTTAGLHHHPAAQVGHGCCFCTRAAARNPRLPVLKGKNRGEKPIPIIMKSPLQYLNCMQSSCTSPNTERIEKHLNNPEWILFGLVKCNYMFDFI